MSAKALNIPGKCQILHKFLEFLSSEILSGTAISLKLSEKLKTNNKSSDLPKGSFRSFFNNF